MVSAVLCLLCWAGVLGIHGLGKREVALQYAAWVKMTDNPKGLTFEEWRAYNKLFQ